MPQDIDDTQFNRLAGQLAFLAAYYAQDLAPSGVMTPDPNPSERPHDEKQ